MMMRKEVHEKRQVWLVKDELHRDGPFLNLVKLPHPKDPSKLTRFLITKDSCYELKAYHEEYRSWFVDQYVVSDGSLYLLIPIDPIFLILPHFHAFNLKFEKKVFVTIDQILVEQPCSKLSVLNQDHLIRDLDLICDTQIVPDLNNTITYALEKRKVIRWLKAKVDQLGEHLQKTPLLLAYFLKNKPCDIADEQLSIYAALNILSEYIEKEWMNLLKSDYGLVSDIEPLSSKSIKLQEMTTMNSAEHHSRKSPINQIKVQNRFTKKVANSEATPSAKFTLKSFFSKKVEGD